MNIRVFFSLLGILAACSPAPETSTTEPTTGDEVVASDADAPNSNDDPPPGFPPANAQHPEMSAEQCAAASAEVIGDIGDGSTHRPDYICPSGATPIGTVPLGIEGAVCCPR